MKALSLHGCARGFTRFQSVTILGCWLALPALGAPIPKLYNTGVDDAGVVLGNNVADPHYTLTVSPDPGFPGPGLVTLNPGFPVGPWLAEGPDSRWIAPRQQSVGNEPGDYTYKTTFDLTGFDPTKAKITGRWVSDNGGVDIVVNGTSLGLTNPGNFDAWTAANDFTIESGFVEGVNTLEFVVNNAGAAVNPTGLRAEVRGTVELPAEAPSIITQPKSQTVVVGDPVTFSVIADGTPPLTYQWKFKGDDLNGKTEATLTIDAVAVLDAGDYTVLVKNVPGEKLSDPATLTVYEPIPGLFNTGVDAAGVILADATVDPHYQLVTNVDNEGVPDALVQDSTVFPIVAGPWIAHLEEDVSRWIGPRAETSAAASGDYVYEVKFDLTGFDPTAAFIAGNWSSDNEGLDILLNGASTGLKNTGGFGAYAPFKISAGFLSGINTLGFKVNNAGLGYTGLRVDGIHGGAKKGAAGDAPRIVSPPTGGFAFVGDGFTFRVVADGTPPLAYKWFHSVKGEIAGQTGATLNIPSVAFPDEGEYTVEVKNNAGTLLSAPPALLKVYERVPGVFSTGVDDQGTLLAEDTVDPHYTMTVSADQDFPGPEARTLLPGFPVGPWIAEGPTSRWIAPTSAQGTGNAPGEYRFETRFNLTGFQLASVVIVGGWAVDNTGLDILLNNQSLGLTSGGFTAVAPFTINSGFVAGENTLVFVMSNAGDAVNPAGLRVDLVAGGRREVSAPPTLTISAGVGEITASWPASAAGFKLFSAKTLPATLWSEVPQPIVVVGDRNTVKVPTTDPALFLQLRK